jgi:hypothetical protein
MRTIAARRAASSVCSVSRGQSAHRPLATSSSSVVTRCRPVTRTCATAALGVWQSGIISCHVCNDIQQIPFVFLQAGTTWTDSVTRLATYDMTLAAGSWMTSAGTGFSNDCLSPKNALYAIDLTKLPENCGVGAINVQQSTNSALSATKTAAVNRGELAAFCIACQPGYARYVMSVDASETQLPYQHASCVQIDNCAVSTWFNFCSRCAVGFVYPYLTSSGVQYNRCVPFPKDQSCMAADAADPLNLFCKYCLPGYSLNQDGVCEQLDPPNCQSGKFQWSVGVPRVDLATSLYLFPSGRGCTSCASGFTAVKATANTFVCGISSYLAGGDYATVTNFVRNCNQYGISSAGLIVCLLCVNGYVVSTDGRQCYAVESLPNCVQASTSTNCAVCLNGYVLVNQACQLQSILNCISYVQSVSSTQQVCTQCASGFFLYSNTCSAGSIANCVSYLGSATSCSACATGFQLIYTSEGVPYCYPLPPSMNCVTFHNGLFQNGVLACNQCSRDSPFFTTTTLGASESPSVCLPHQLINNCTSYSTATIPGFSSFQCLTCADGYFLSNKACVRRTTNITNCLTYSTSSNTCVKCADNFYLASSNTQCMPFPVGLNYCRTYVSTTQCGGVRDRLLLQQYRRKLHGCPRPVPDTQLLVLRLVPDLYPV